VPLLPQRGHAPRTHYRRSTESVQSPKPTSSPCSEFIAARIPRPSEVQAHAGRGKRDLMQMTDSSINEQDDVFTLDQITLTYAVGVIVLLILNLAGYGLIALSA